MFRHHSVIHTLTAVVLVCCASGRVGRTDGFRNPPEGAAAFGRGGSRLTETGDPSAVTHNPANLVDLPRAAVMPTVNIGYAEKTYEAPTGASEEMEVWSVMPALYASFPASDGTFAFGFGLSTPYGQSNEWGERGIFTGIQPYYSNLQSINASPVLAVRLCETLSFGAGVDVIWSELELRQTNPWSGMPGDTLGPATRIKLKGDGMGVGAHAGLTWRMSPRQRVAVVYKSPISVDLEGEFEADNLPPGLPPIVTPESYFTSDLEFPQMVALGYGLQLTDSLRVEANVEWLEHSAYSEAELDVGNNNVLLQGTENLEPVVVEQNWNDEWTVSLGADWEVSDAWVLRGGWIYLPSPVPDETLGSTTVEGDSNILTVGFGFRGGSQRLDAALAVGLNDDRTDAFGGEYKIDSGIASIAYGYSF